MALCRLEAKIISRSGGRSTVGSASYRTGKCATSAAAYRAGAELTDERTGKTFDYSRKRGVEGAEIMLPAGAPDWMRDREQLWNAVEKAEKRSDAQLARDYILTLPHELDADQRRTLSREFVREQFVDKGYAADIAWHAPHGQGDERNHHAHVMVVMRRIEGDGFARTKERPPEGKHPAEQWKADLRAQREAWANAGGNALERAGFHVEAERFRAGHLTLAQQREAAIARGDTAWAEALDREAEPKQGPLATKIEREGRESHAGNDRRAVQERNAERARLKEEHARVSAEIIDLQAEREKRARQAEQEKQARTEPTQDRAEPAPQRAPTEAPARASQNAAAKAEVRPQPATAPAPAREPSEAIQTARQSFAAMAGFARDMLDAGGKAIGRATATVEGFFAKDATTPAPERKPEEKQQALRRDARPIEVRRPAPTARAVLEDRRQQQPTPQPAPQGTRRAETKPRATPAAPPRQPAPQVQPARENPGFGRAAGKAAIEVADTAGKAIGKLADVVGGFFGGGSNAPPEPPERHGHTAALRQMQEQRRANAALERIRDSMERGHRIRAEDLQNLAPNHIENIRAKGDDGLRQIIDRHRREQERGRDWGRERER